MPVVDAVFLRRDCDRPAGWHLLGTKRPRYGGLITRRGTKRKELRLIRFDSTKLWYGSTLEERGQLRRSPGTTLAPEFHGHVRALLRRQIAVVTFSPQAALIRALLHVLSPGAAAIQLRTADPAEMWAGVPVTSEAGRKAAPQASAWECCGLGEANICDWRSVMLVDDDRLNIDTAEHWGARAVLIWPDAPDTEMRAVSDMCAALYDPPASSPGQCFATPPNPGCMHHTRGFTGRNVANH